MALFYIFWEIKKIILRHKKFMFSFQIPTAEAAVITELLARYNSSLI
jgi:hypothetical protein